MLAWRHCKRPLSARVLCSARLASSHVAVAYLIHVTPGAFLPFRISWAADGAVVFGMGKGKDKDKDKDGGKRLTDGRKLARRVEDSLLEALLLSLDSKAASVAIVFAKEELTSIHSVLLLQPELEAELLALAKLEPAELRLIKFYCNEARNREEQPLEEEDMQWPSEPPPELSQMPYDDPDAVNKSVGAKVGDA